uniref:Acrosin n=1 Tax=Salvator merianae TaxID=96440 RepID=A0A8D0E5M0_SALMN
SALLASLDPQCPWSLMYLDCLPFTSFSSGVCGRRPLAPSHGGSARIVGGTDTLPGTWPWMVSIQKPSQGGYMHICGGSLISSLWVVTAAHCSPHYYLHLVIGITQISQPGPDTQERSIKNLVQHEQYVQRTHYNDIALMELNEPVNCTDYIQPACLPDTNVVISALTHCYISGWGRMSSTVYTSDILQEARVNIIPLELCNSSNWYHKKIHYNNICAGFEQGGIDSCQGDSGGPLMCREGRSERFWVIGATSWGIGCANAQKPGVYTSTQHFLDWIRGITNEEFQKPKRPLHFWTEASPKTSIPATRTSSYAIAHPVQHPISHNGSPIASGHSQSEDKDKIFTCSQLPANGL